MRRKLWWMVGLVSLLASCSSTTASPGRGTSSAASSTVASPSTSAGDESRQGPQRVTGRYEYSGRPDLWSTEWVLVMEDMTGDIEHDPSYVVPRDGQVLARTATEDLSSPVEFTIDLPISPTATTHDFDGSGSGDPGVMVYSIDRYNNIVGDNYRDPRDQEPGIVPVSSSVVRDGAGKKVVGGTLVVFASTAGDSFPSGFGADEVLFTADDPVEVLPEGWSLVNLDITPFTVEAPSARTITIGNGFVNGNPADFSDLSYLDAFDGLIEFLRERYPYTELKQLDWDAIDAQFRPEFEQASSTHDFDLAMRHLYNSIPDFHMMNDWSIQPVTPLDDDQARATEGGLGLALRPLDDGTYVVSYLTPGGPAEAAGIALGAAVSTLGGTPIDAAVVSTVPWNGPFSSDLDRRLQQTRYVTRFPLSAGSVEVSFTNPGEQARRVDLAVVVESDSFDASSYFGDLPYESLPVEFSVLPDGRGYIRINTFQWDDLRLTLMLWERAMRYLRDNEIQQLVIDMRANLGGSEHVALQMVGYLFDEPMVLTAIETYDEDSGAFVRGPTQTAFPPPPADRFSGDVAVLIGDACASACESFVWYAAHSDKVSLVGEYPTVGAGGTFGTVWLPYGIQYGYTMGRSVDLDGTPIIEGTGVAPTVKVPVDLDTVLREAAGDDVVLEAALRDLDARA